MKRPGKLSGAPELESGIRDAVKAFGSSVGLTLARAGLPFSAVEECVVHLTAGMLCGVAKSIGWSLERTMVVVAQAYDAVDVPPGPVS